MVKNHSFKVGDQVELLNESITGKIIKINGRKIILLSNDGFEYECKIKEIVANSDLHELFKEEMDDKIVSEENSFSKKSLKKKSKNNAQILEVDLHIHHLVSSEKGMTNFNMLSIQLKTAKTQLELAIKNKRQRLVFIHGIGEGVLRRELHQLLKRYPVEFYEGSYQKYGQGATEVYLFQNKKH